MVEKIKFDEFIQRTMGGRPCALSVGIYFGCTYECGCGKTHSFNSATKSVIGLLVLQLNEIF